MMILLPLVPFLGLLIVLAIGAELINDPDDKMQPYD